MRMLVAALIALMPCLAMAGEVEDAHKRAVTGRDAYWNCLAREYPRETNRALSAADFAALVASVCASERQNLRVALVDYLALQRPDADASTHMTTANNAIALAQKDVVTAFTRRQEASKQRPK
jgi:hypothetical protein